MLILFINGQTEGKQPMLELHEVVERMGEVTNDELLYNLRLLTGVTHTRFYVLFRLMETHDTAGYRLGYELFSHFPPITSPDFHSDAFFEELNKRIKTLK